MERLSFRGGIHPPHAKKLTEGKATTEMPAPEFVFIPMSQHIGAPAKPLVQKGDMVYVGQKIGEAAGFVSANVHSSVSGEVVGIVNCFVPNGLNSICVQIKNDMEYNIHEEVRPYGNVNDLSSEDLLNIVKEIGLVGMGGATFPAHVKLSPPEDKTIDTLILNGAECEPYLTADHRLMLENPEDIVQGMKAVMKILHIENGIIGIEDNKPECIKVLKNATKHLDSIKVIGLQTKYPQGAEKQLIAACTQREVPSGGLPMDVNVVVQNVASVAQIGKSLRTGLPLIERICTVTGSGINQPQNIWIKIGTKYQDIVEFCGGIKDQTKKIISGGPMMGMAQPHLNVASTKGSSGLLFLTKEEVNDRPMQNCIRCSKCVNICPIHLQPNFISAYALKDQLDQAESYHALDCIECGSCSFVCPAGRPLLQSIRMVKKDIMTQKRKQM